MWSCAPFHDTTGPPYGHAPSGNAEPPYLVRGWSEANGYLCSLIPSRVLPFGLGLEDMGFNSELGKSDVLFPQQKLSYTKPW